MSTRKPAHGCFQQLRCQYLKQPRCPSVGKKINKPWYIQTREHYSAEKETKLSSSEKKGGKYKCIVPRERANLKRLHTEANHVMF
jgi:hypothetical protein